MWASSANAETVIVCLITEAPDGELVKCQVTSQHLTLNITFLQTSLASPLTGETVGLMACTAVYTALYTFSASKLALVCV